MAWHLRRLRVERGLSQEALAVDAAVDRGYVSGIERGTFNPTVEVLERLAAALAVDIAAFFVVPRKGEPVPAPLRPTQSSIGGFRIGPKGRCLLHCFCGLRSEPRVFAALRTEAIMTLEMDCPHEVETAGVDAAEKVEFRYDDLEPDVGARLRACAVRIREKNQALNGTIFEIGRTLNEAKNLLPHGRFLAWLRLEFDWPERTAQRYMRIARVLGEKTATVSDLSLRAMDALTARSTPKELRDELLEELAAGKAPSIPHPPACRAMITGAARGSGRGEALARHLKKAENDEVVLVHARGLGSETLSAQIRELVALSLGGRTDRPIYHVHADPDPDIADNAGARALFWRLFEAEFGLGGQPFCGVEHVKRGRRHEHRVYGLVRPDGSVVDMAWDYLRREKCARVVEHACRVPPVPSKHARAVTRRLREVGRHDVADWLVCARATEAVRPIAPLTPNERLIQERSSDEPSESAMRDTLARTITASYRQHVAGLGLVGERMPPVPAVTAFRSYGCTPAIGAPGYVCDIDFAVNGVDKGRGKGRFYKEADGSFAVADR